MQTESFGDISMGTPISFVFAPHPNSMSLSLMQKTKLGYIYGGAICLMQQSSVFLGD